MIIDTQREREGGEEKSYFSVLCCFVHPKKKERQGKKEQTRQKN
jgi:hypothetical protein